MFEFFKFQADNNLFFYLRIEFYFEFYDIEMELNVKTKCKMAKLNAHQTRTAFKHSHNDYIIK